MPRNSWMNLPEGPTRRFFASLNDLWWSKGAPPGRRISSELEASEVYVSQGTVQNLINGPRLPKWETAAAVVHHLGGDHEAFLSLWRVAAQSTLLAARQEPSGGSPHSGSGNTLPPTMSPPDHSASAVDLLDPSALETELRELRLRGLTRSTVESLPGLALAVVKVLPQSKREGMTRATTARELLLRAARQLDPVQQRAATALFGLEGPERDLPASERRKRAAYAYGVTVERFRKSQERLIISHLAEIISVLCVSSRVHQATEPALE